MIYSSIGYYALIFGLVTSIPIFFFSVKNFRNKEILDNKIINYFFIKLFLVIISFFGLVFSFVYSDFSNETVFNNSHTTKPLFYKISGTWGIMHEVYYLVVDINFVCVFIFVIFQQTAKKI